MNLLATHSIALLLLLFIALGLMANNHSVTIAACILLLIQQTPLVKYVPLIEQHGLNLGIIILTIAVLSPLISGKIKAEDLIHVLSHWRTLLAVAVGMFVAWLAGRGTHLMLNQPMTVTGLLIGTILGVAFLRGVPVGPLIAAGILSLLLWK
jgi:uncharacterized membrane protein (DUF441 family)